jgi:hypothetical protein
MNRQRKKINNKKTANAQKIIEILCQRTKHTFIFLPTHEANPKKNERVFSPPLLKSQQSELYY